ncbi:MAG: polysaccharide biosynthesis C-terminal domain-containing protein [Candidatus Neomarinimicrobiota bacterium]|jgi:O-antigen/teichoic acid export membrane protein
MRKIRNFMRSFTDRGGVHIFTSTFLSKIAGFVLSVLVVRLFSKEVYGYYSYAHSVMIIILPLSGFGLHHALLRFASIENDNNKKIDLFTRFLSVGFLGSLLLSILIILLSKVITTQLPEAGRYLKLLSPLTITFFLSELLFSLYRSMKDNRTYAFGMLTKALLLLGLCYLMSKYFGADGYAISYVLVPFIVALTLFALGRKKHGFRLKNNSDLKLKEYIKYGLFVGLGSIASQLVLMMDTIMIGNILADSSQLANYRVATILPINLLLLPAILLRTDFVYIAEKYLNKEFLLNYYKKYLLTFTVILVAIFTVWLIFDDQIIRIFGPEYASVKPIILVLLIMLVGNFLFRTPLGNMLAAVGKSSWNTVSNTILVVENIILNFILIPQYSIMGAAIATTISIWTSGLINIILFRHYLRKTIKSVK